MTPERWKDVDRVWHAVLARPEGERAAAVAELCGGDETLRREVESLLLNLARASAAGFGVAGSAVVVGREPLVGRRFGPYAVQSLLGVGGMGEVYQAHDETLGRDVAIKILPEMWLTDPERRARFDREARLLASLNHPNIGAIHGVHESDGTRALVLELVEGETLAERIDSYARSAAGARGLPLRDALLIARQIAEALEAAHDRGVVHRDLKPANIKITSDERAKVLDFGLAKTATEADSDTDLTYSSNVAVTATDDGVLLGTAPYMSPEQARGKPVDKRSDVWAFGCVLYEMLTGKRAFDGTDVTDTLSRVLRSEPDFAALPTHTPMGVRRLLARCLEKDRSKRLPQIAIAVFQIEEAMAGSPPSHETTPDLRGRRQIVLAVALMLLGVVAGSTITWFWASRERVSTPVARLLVGVSPADRIGGVDGRLGRTALAISPDGRTLVFSASRANGLALYRRDLDQSEATPILGSEGGINPFFSPDGTWVGYWAAGEIRKVPLAGGPSLPITKEPITMFGASWGDDDRIVFSRAAGGLLEVPAAGGAPIPLTELNRNRGEVSHRLPYVLPGGEAILFTVTKERFPRWDQTQISVHSRRTGVSKVLVEGGADARYVSTGHLLYVRESVLLAAPFDPQRLQLTGGSVGVVPDVSQAAYHRGASEDSGAAQLTISTTGTAVFIPGGTVVPAERSVVSVDRTGRSETLPITPRAFATLRLSPDGQQVALSTFGRDREIWLYALARGTLAKLSAPGRNGVPIWTPDGQWLTYAAGTSGPDSLRRVRADGNGSSQSLVESEHHLVPGAWTPDSRTLFYYQIPSAGTSVDSTWMWGPGGSEKAMTIEGVGANGDGVDVSSDGRWIAYHSDHSGRLEVYVQAHPGPGPRYQVSTDGGMSPIWSRDGRELFYVRPSAQAVSSSSASLSSGDVRVMTVRATLQPALALGAPQQLFSGSYQMNTPARAYDVTADGRQFLMLQARELAPAPITHMVVVQNWFDELRRLVPRN